MVSILDLPTESLWIIASNQNGGEISALARANRTLYPKLRPPLIRYNIKFQNSSALHWAAKTNDVKFAKILISYGAAVNAVVDGANETNKNGESALWHGVSKKSFKVVNRLLQHPDIAIDLCNREGQIALWLAVFHGSSDMVQLLLSNGANPEIKALDGISPWIQSCIRDRNGIKDMLLNCWCTRSPPILSRVTISANERETMFSAATNGNISTMQTLLLSGEQLDAVDHQERTLLHVAAEKGHVAVVDFLLRRNQTLLNRKDKNGRNALWISTYSARECVTTRLLEESDIDVNTLAGNSRYRDLSTSLHHVVTGIYTTALRQLLAIPSLDPNRCTHSQSALCLAISEGRAESVRLLVMHPKTQINAQSPGDDSPLHLATEIGDADTVRLLVRQNGRLLINQLNSHDGESALSVAIRRGRLDILKILLTHPHIDLDAVNRWGETALLLAAKSGRIAMVERLLGGPKLPLQLVAAAGVARRRGMGDIIANKARQVGHSSSSPRQSQL